MENEKIYDTVIIGGGAAGYTAALYAARAGLNTLVIEKLSAGGQMALTNHIENYPGFLNEVDGYELSVTMQKQAEKFGVITLYAEVIGADLKDAPKRIYTNDKTFYAKAVIIATGASPKKLGVSNEEALVGKGVSYCATCDGMFYKGKTVVIVGGGNTAVTEALVMSRVAQKVFLVHRSDRFRATKIYSEPLKNSDNIELLLNSVVCELLYDEKLIGVKIKSTVTGEICSLNCDGIFISIGRNPETKIVEGQLSLDHGGYIIADESTKTSISGVFAAGDVRTKSLRQIVTAVSDGAVSAIAAEEYINEQK